MTHRLGTVLGTGVTSDEMHALYEQVKAIHAELRAEAERTHGYGAWGAVQCLESAQYYIFGAFGWLAKDEGLLEAARAEVANPDTGVPTDDVQSDASDDRH